MDYVYHLCSEGHHIPMTPIIESQDNSCLFTIEKYAVPVGFCPFCGVELDEEEVDENESMGVL